MSAHPAIDQLDFARARVWLERYCRTHGLSGVERRLEQSAGRTLACLCVPDPEGAAGRLRFCLGERGWNVFREVAGGECHPFPGVVCDASWDEVAQALEAAPLHVHWSFP